MYIGQINHIDEATPLAGRLRRVFEFMAGHDLDRLPGGRIDLDGDDLFIKNDHTTMLPAAERRLEVHRRYIDVMLPLDRAETIGWKPASGIAAMAADYDPGRDVGFAADAPQCYVEVRPGQFAIFSPADAHAPAIGSGPIHKLVAKIRTSD